MSTMHILVIGASGGIGQAVVNEFSKQFSDATIHALSRSKVSFSAKNVTSFQLATDSEEDIKQWCEQQKNAEYRFVVGCMGILHKDTQPALKPEKRLEDIKTDNLAEYFKVNSIVPALWIKYLVKVVSNANSCVCFLSARVGSISDNQLGGWYGYRASKSALNMLIKTASIEYRRRTKRTAFVCYHPGTVDTALSKPFQQNVKPSKLFTSDFTAQRLVNVMRSVDVEGGPYYVDWDGKSIDW